jgi:hypothetical protein
VIPLSARFRNLAREIFQKNKELICFPAGRVSGLLFRWKRGHCPGSGAKLSTNMDLILPLFGYLDFIQ